MKRVIKIAGAACVATGVAVTISLVASGAALGAIAEGFRAASDAVKKVLNDGKDVPVADESVVVRKVETVVEEDFVEENL